MTFTAKIDLSLASKLRSDLEEQGFEFSQPPFTVFLAKKKGVSCALYESGKLTVQGKEKDPFIEFYLEPEILKTFQNFHPEANVDFSERIGMDEAGKGDFFGPLCVAAIHAGESEIKEMIKMGVKDSKKMTDAVICKLASKLRATFPYTVIRLFPHKYNELYEKFNNLNRLLAWAHSAALGDLSQKTGCKKALLDQFAHKSLVENMLRQKKLEIQLEQRVRAEEDPVVAAASILARAAFVDGMDALSKEYGIEIPKGAGPKVIEVAQTLVAKHGKEVLRQTAKTNFKTMDRL